MEGFRAAGVNRVSFGVQSFRDDELARSAGSTRPIARAAAVAEARAAGFDNISLDLMMWLPQQTRDDWQESVEALIDVGPDHVSLYLLELYPNAPLKEDMARGRLVAGAGRRRGGHVPAGLERLDARRLSPVRDLERVPRRAASRATTSSTGRTASGSASAAARIRPAAASRWKNVAATSDVHRCA